MQMKKIKIIIADDHMLFAEGIKNLLSNFPGIEVIDIATDGKELLDILLFQKPDIILLDINMPRLNGIETIKKINIQHKEIKVVVLSTYNDEHLIQEARHFGAKG